MPSASLLSHQTDPRRPALIDGAGGRRLTHADLRAEVAAAAERVVAARPGLVALRSAHDMPTVVAWLGAFEAGCPVLWLDPAEGRPALERLLDAYRPGLVVLGARDHDAPVAGYAETPWPGARAWRATGDEPPPHPDLACLLSTSGSTGSPRVVRLAREAVAANAAAIVTALGLRPDDTALLSLPLAHAFGLSVLNSHLLAGGTLVLTRSGLLQADYWRLARDERVTCLPGVPWTFELLARLDPEQVLPARVRLLAQAGGRLAPALARTLRDLMRARRGELRVMYGQTEATARISAWPADIDDDKLASVGRAIPGGRLGVDPAGGEVLFRGPSVMMGYADGRAALARPAEIDELRTGDLGHVDGDGFLFLTGRLRRIAKLAGRRLNLDDVEALVAGFPAAAIEHEGRLRLFVEGASAHDAATIAGALGRRLGLDRGWIEAVPVARLPRTSSGKLAYGAL